MKHSKKSFTLLMLLTLIIGSRTLAQDLLNSNVERTAKLAKEVPVKQERTMEVLQDNEGTNTGYEQRQPYNPLVLNGKSLGYGQFNVQLKCDLMVSKGAADPFISSLTIARELFYFDAKLKAEQAKEVQAKQERAMEVMQGNKYASSGYEPGRFYDNLVMLNGKPLDYSEFNLQSKGELTVAREAAIAGKTTLIPFYVYLRRNGNNVLIPGKERPNPTQTKIEISEILEHAEPGDYLVIEAVNKEDSPVTRILKLLGRGC